MLRRIGEEMARRWISRDPGPLGADAPPRNVTEIECWLIALRRRGLGAS